MKQPRKLKKRTEEAIVSANGNNGKNGNNGNNGKKELRKMLLGKRQALAEELRRELARHLGRVHRELGLDEAEQAGISAEEEIGLTAVSQRTALVKQIDRTLEHVKEGTYGICEYCGDGISIGRLKVMPFAVRCTDCQDRWEASVALSRNGASLPLMRAS